MPLLQYKCPKCNKNFEKLVKTFSVEVTCPDCGTVAERSYSGEMYSSTGVQYKKCSGNCKTCGGCK
jgi:putative FmdB family regulatory protein